VFYAIACSFNMGFCYEMIEASTLDMDHVEDVPSDLSVYRGSRKAITGCKWGFDHQSEV
jgi:hypothetical protein